MCIRDSVDTDGVAAAHGGAGTDTIELVVRGAWTNGRLGTVLTSVTGGYGSDAVSIASFVGGLVIVVDGDEPATPGDPREGDADRIALTGRFAEGKSTTPRFEAGDLLDGRPPKRLARIR